MSETPNSTDPYPPYEINYAHIFGITEAPAIAFVVIYFVILVACAIYSFTFLKAKFVKTTFPYLSLYSSLRLISFALRAAVAVKGTNLELFTAETVFQAAGFFALINVSYSLMKLWYDQAKEYMPIQLQQKMTSITRIAHILLMVGIAIGVAGGVMSATAKDGSSSEGTSLTTGSRWIFFILTTVFFLICSFGALKLQQGNSEKTASLEKDVAILALIGAFLCIKTSFGVATIYNAQLSKEENYFYPLSVVPEILVMIVYCFPKVVARFEYEYAVGV